MAQLKEILNFNKAVLMVTTSLVVVGCTTVSEQNHAGTTTTDPAVTQSTSNSSEKGLSQARLMRVADRAWKQGNPGTALRLYNMAAQKNPKAVGPYLAIAEILRKTKRADAAIDVYKGVLKNNSDSIEAHTGIGYSLLTLEKPYMAAQSFEAAVAIDPQNAKSLGGIAVALDTAGEHEKAQDYYRHAIKVDPNNLTYQNNLALSLALSGRIEQAIAMLEIITAHPKATAKHRQNLALVYGMAGKSADAMRYSRMDLSERDARNNALYFQALNSDSTSQVAEQQEKIYAMAFEKKRKKASTEATLQAFTQLAARSETTILSANIEIEQNIEDHQEPTAPQQPHHHVQYADIPSPANLIPERPAQNEDVAASSQETPTSVIEAEAQVKPTSDIVETLAEPVTAPSEPPEIKSTSLTTALYMPEIDEFIEGKARTAERDLTSNLYMPEVSDIVVKSPPTYRSAVVQHATFVPAPSSNSTHVYFAQVGSFKTPERALNGWKILKERHSDILADFDPIFAKAELGPEKGGTFYRVRIGSFDQKSTPLNLCMNLRNRDEDCYMPRVSKNASKQAPTEKYENKSPSHYNVAYVSY